VDRGKTARQVVLSFANAPIHQFSDSPIRQSTAGPIFPGDVIESEIEGLGLLRNRVESIPADPVYAQRAGL
jgi:2-keto-4-pentenoate hydratase/2-oxohepta-3-ene-1,7-dioic acid hydratase in catechol pathway